MRARGISELNNTLRKLDRKAANEMRKQLRATILPVAREIANDVPAQPPLSGMIRDRQGNAVNGVTRWTGVPRASVSFTPGRARSSKTQNILSMKFTGGTRAGGGIGFDYAELAGSSNRSPNPYSRTYERNGIPGYQHRVTGQGRAFVRGIRSAKPIRGKGGYYAFDSAVKRYGSIEGIGERAIRKFMADTSAEILRQRFIF